MAMSDYVVTLADRFKPVNEDPCAHYAVAGGRRWSDQGNWRKRPAMAYATLNFKHYQRC
jgi:hypothetical protein